jgi:hypothetical protein
MVLIACLFVMHGFAHLAGFVVPWHIMDIDETPYKTTLLGGKVDIGDTGIKIIGIVWLLTALGFFIMATVILLQREWWLVGSVIIAGFSTLMCIIGWPDSRIGLFLNLLILAFLLTGKSLNWF